MQQAPASMRTAHKWRWMIPWVRGSIAARMAVDRWAAIRLERSRESRGSAPRLFQTLPSSPQVVLLCGAQLAPRPQAAPASQAQPGGGTRSKARTTAIDRHATAEELNWLLE